MEVLTYPLRRKINWANPPDPTKRCSSDLICGDGRRFTGSFRTVCHMAWMFEELAKDHPEATLHVIQPPYHTGFAGSAGTHDYDCCSDVWIFGLAPRVGEAWLRRKGFWCWWRHTGSWAAQSEWHFHGFTGPAGVNFATRVGVFVDGGLSSTGHVFTTSQIEDARNHALGLSLQHTPGSDPAPWPPSPYPRFDLPAFVKQKEQDLMEFKDWGDVSKKQFASVVADIVARQVAQGNKDLLATPVVVRDIDGSGTQKISLKQAWVRAANSLPWLRNKTASKADVQASDAANV